LSVAFSNALKTRKRKRLNGKPQTIVTTPAITECRLKWPKAKSTTAQIEKKTSAVGRFILINIMLHSRTMLNTLSELTRYHVESLQRPINVVISMGRRNTRLRPEFVENKSQKRWLRSSGRNFALARF
jgi:2-methylisocitrate lyase-like PEP mutase family enzyme